MLACPLLLAGAHMSFHQHVSMQTASSAANHGSAVRAEHCMTPETMATTMLHSTDPDVHLHRAVHGQKNAQRQHLSLDAMPCCNRYYMLGTKKHHWLPAIYAPERAHKCTFD